MVAELIQALGGLLNFKWIADGFITEGALCTAQGRLKQLGDVGVALFSLVIAFDTFFMLSFGWRGPKKLRSCALIGVGIFIVLVVAVGSGVNSGKNPPYYGNTKFWCWIRPEYKTERIALEYFWMWFSASVMLVLYGIIALVMYGFIVVEGKKIRLRNEDDKRAAKEQETSSYIDNEDKANRLIANMMLFYPAIYIFCVLPVSIVRWLDFSGHTVSRGATLFSSVVFSLSGFFNVLLFKFTRPALISGDNLDPPSRHDLPTLVLPYSDLPAGAGGTNHNPTGFGMLPDDSEMSSPVVASPASETSAARYARIHARSHTASSSDTRPRTQESLRPGSRDSPAHSRFGTLDGSGSVRATGLGRLPE